MMKCAVLLPVFSLPNQSKAFRRDTVFFLLPPFSTGCAKMVGFPYAHKSRAFERKHGAASRNTWSGLLGLSEPLIRESVITIDQSAANACRTTVHLAR